MRLGREAREVGRAPIHESGLKGVRRSLLEQFRPDVLGDSHDVEGFVSIDWLKTEKPFANADFYLCGPKPFLRSLVRGLILAGVQVDRIHYEFFGPADELLAA